MTSNISQDRRTVRFSSLSPEERVRRAQLGAHYLHAKHDSRKLTEPARKAFLAKFEKEADPDGVLSPEERQKRARHLYRAHMLRLSMASLRARRLKAEGQKAEGG